MLDFPRADPDPQGFLGWTHGYYNITADGEPPSNTNFIVFPTDGSNIRGIGNWWDGNNFDFVHPDGTTANPPWTWLAQEAGHPNGNNNGDVHWTVRRWQVQSDGPLALVYHVRKENTNGGNGTTAIVLHNGRPLDSLTVGGTNGTGLTSWFYVNAKAGDQVAVALSPRGTDGSNNDGSDGSYFWLLVDPGPGDLTLVWTSLDSKDYQIEQLTNTAPVTWAPIGPTINGEVGTTQGTLNGIFGPARLFRVREMDPLP
jgi:hypothetical protein